MSDITAKILVDSEEDASYIKISTRKIGERIFSNKHKKTPQEIQRKQLYPRLVVLDNSEYRICTF